MKINKLFKKEYMRIISQQNLFNGDIQYHPGCYYQFLIDFDEFDRELDYNYILYIIELVTNGVIKQSEVIKVIKKNQFTDQIGKKLLSVISPFIVETDYFISCIEDLYSNLNIYVKCKKLVNGQEFNQSHIIPNNIQMVTTMGIDGYQPGQHKLETSWQFNKIYAQVKRRDTRKIVEEIRKVLQQIRINNVIQNDDKMFIKGHYYHFEYLYPGKNDYMVQHGYNHDDVIHGNVNDEYFEGICEIDNKKTEVYVKCIKTVYKAYYYNYSREFLDGSPNLIEDSLPTVAFILFGKKAINFEITQQQFNKSINEINSKKNPENMEQHVDPITFLERIQDRKERNRKRFEAILKQVKIDDEIPDDFNEFKRKYLQ